MLSPSSDDFVLCHTVADKAFTYLAAADDASPLLSDDKTRGFIFFYQQQTNRVFLQRAIGCGLFDVLKRSSLRPSKPPKVTKSSPA